MSDEHNSQQTISRILLVAVVATTLLAVMAAPVDATPSSDVTMEGFNPAPDENGDRAPGTFTASGPAVDSGTMCASGSTEYELIELSGPIKNPNGINFKVRKWFDCDDGSGSFLLKAQGRFLFARGDSTFSWVILRGTGVFEDLHGTGSGTAINVVDGVDDFFEGGLHLD